MTEIWKSITGYEGYYEVSDHGRVRSVEHLDKSGHVYKSKVLANKKGQRGYRRVHLSKDGISKWHAVHRLVAAEFCEKQDGMDIVNHIDNDPSNNCASNLEWTDYKGNMQHAAKQGRMGWQPENLAKAVEARKKPVVAISKDGSRQEFSSSAEAGIVLGVSSGHIAACCRQEYGYKTVGGYVFEYADKELQKSQKPNKVGKSKEEQIEELRKRMMGNKINVGRSLSDETKHKLSIANGYPIRQLDKDSGDEIAVYPSASLAQKSTGIRHIADCANGKRKTAGGFKWQYIKEKNTGNS